MTSQPTPGRRGRRPAGEDTRARIEEVARAEFAEKGYDATSLRAVARLAGVDPALVHHYFDNKADLFARAVVHMQVNPAAIVARVLAGPRETLGERVVRTFVAVWDEPEHTERLVALLRAAQTNEQVGALFRQFVQREMVGRLVHASAAEDAALRGALAGSQIVGLATVRYVVRMEPVASASADQLVRWVAPTLQRYLVGPE